VKCSVTVFEGLPAFGQLESLTGLSEFVLLLLIYIKDWCFLVSAGGDKVSTFQNKAQSYVFQIDTCWHLWQSFMQLSNLYVYSSGQLANILRKSDGIFFLCFKVVLCSNGGPCVQVHEGSPTLIIN